MAESTALAEHRDADTERHDKRTVVTGEPAAAATAASTAAAVLAEPLVAEELLVEEVSIDGMCGVY